MGDIPTSVNTAANTVDSVIQAAIYNVALNALRTAAYSYLPWLKLPVVNQIFNLILNTIAKYIYTYLSQVATFAVIDLQTDSEKNSYNQAVTQLQGAIATGDQNAISQAQADFEKKLAALIHSDGSSTH